MKPLLKLLEMPFKWAWRHKLKAVGRGFALLALAYLDERKK